MPLALNSDITGCNASKRHYGDVPFAHCGGEVVKRRAVVNGSAFKRHSEYRVDGAEIIAADGT